MINQYKYFLAVAKYENLRRAAETLYITQPALSASISRLEKELDVRLIQHEGRSIKLTPIARQLIPYFTEICNNYSQISSIVESYNHSQSNMINVGTTIRHSVLSVDEFLLTYPDKQVHLQQFFKYEDLKDALFSQNLDFCISSPLIEDSAVANDELIHEPLCVLLHTANPLSSHSSLSVSDLDGLPTFRHPDGYPFNMTLMRMYESSAHQPSQITAVADNASLLLLLLTDRCRDHILINPISRCKEIVEMYPVLAYIPLTDPGAYREIGVSWLKKRPLSENAKQLVQFLHFYYGREKYHL